jgi:hypothetical protein
MIRQKMLDLIKYRSQILSGNLPVDEIKDLKIKATTEIDTGNKILGELANICSTLASLLLNLP